ncbi:MAG TPA: hypothetical protein VFQ73_15770 [Flavisolibacter sp.]|nr:hypothetical protein [Flavisolibacter sp.]
MLRKNIESHAWWLISTVFSIMMPLYLTQVLILAMIVAGAWKYGKLKHPATFVAIAVNPFIFL